MSTIKHVAEPDRLLLTWQPPQANGAKGSRLSVGELVRKDEVVLFRYDFESKDFAAAIQQGFRGFPAFNMDKQEHSSGVLDAFMRRLPPKKREDYDSFLSQHMLPSNFQGSDFALLGITGARLPSDTFELCIDLTGLDLPVDVLLLVAGHRYHAPALRTPLYAGQSVELVREPNNEHDPQAIRVEVDGQRIGYVNKAACSGVSSLAKRSAVSAEIARLNGTKDHPKVYILVSFSEVGISQVMRG